MLNDPKLTDFSAFNALISLYLKLARNKLILFLKNDTYIHHEGYHSHLAGK